jgi:hypothetical protein
MDEARRLVREEAERLRAAAAELDYERRALRRGFHVRTETEAQDEPLCSPGREYR